jgi:hypothetical protein
MREKFNNFLMGEGLALKQASGNQRWDHPLTRDNEQEGGGYG